MTQKQKKHKFNETCYSEFCIIYLGLVGRNKGMEVTIGIGFLFFRSQILEHCDNDHTTLNKLKPLNDVVLSGLFYMVHEFL